MAELKFPLKHKRTTLERGEKFLSDKYFAEYNLYSRLIKARHPLSSLEHFAPPPPGRITYNEAVQGKFSPSKVGDAFGPTWSTHWFKVVFQLPEAWLGEHVVLEWDSNSEAMIWKDGTPLQGFSTMVKRNTFLISDNLKENQLSHTYYIEMACNKQNGAGSGSEIAPPLPNQAFTLNRAGVAVINVPCEKLYRDIEVLHSFAEEMSEDNPRSWQALYTMNRIINTVNLDDADSIEKCHQIAADYFKVSNGGGQMTLHAIANCHIDTAWLWPYAETIRKCARSFTSIIRLMEVYPQLTFACSQAQQFFWMKEQYPSLYKEMKTYIESGRFLPVGGTWVEMDGLVPSGEGFVRQFLYGQKFFKQEFGKYCTEFWLPDTFGYSAQFPQIMDHCGIHRFVTQKMSWSLVNKFPNHTFWWTGLNGSKVLSHFPPGDCYSMEGKYKEVKFSVTNFQDKGRSNSALYLFGTGDGGQGPTAPMIERLQRMENSDGCPRVKFSTVSEFFDQIEAEDSERLSEWKGELYLELHNATYTTQANTKKGNRVGEIVLQDSEILCTIACLLNPGHAYPGVELLRLWRLLLLNQFHDVLPGTSIEMVYEDAARYYTDIQDSTASIKRSALQKIIPSESASPVLGIFNTCNWPRTEVICISSDSKCYDSVKAVQCARDGEKLVYCEVPSYGLCTYEDKNVEPVRVETVDGFITLKNNQLTVVLDSACRIVLLKHSKDTSPCGIIEALKPGSKKGNQFVIYDDIPLYWDAWDVMDYHLETRKPVESVTSNAEVLEAGPLRAVVQCTIAITDNSSIELTAILDANSPYVRFDTQVHWHEAHKFLKVEFPVNALVNEATYEIQFGHLKRNTHFNTSWDSAKYEVCGHKWADVSEYNRGVAILNDCKYGWSCIGNNLCLSLLRSSKSPDPHADMGNHSFTYAAMPHTGSIQESGVIQAAYNLNKPLLTFTSDKPIQPQSFITVDSQAVVIEAFKKSEDLDDVYVLRMYDSHGSTMSCDIQVNLPLYNARLCNGLEEPLSDQSALSSVESNNGSDNHSNDNHSNDNHSSESQQSDNPSSQLKFTLMFKPFQIHSLLLYL